MLAFTGAAGIFGITLLSWCVTPACLAMVKMLTCCFCHPACRYWTQWRWFKQDHSPTTTWLWNLMIWCPMFTAAHLATWGLYHSLPVSIIDSRQCVAVTDATSPHRTPSHLQWIRTATVCYVASSFGPLCSTSLALPYLSFRLGPLPFLRRCVVRIPFDVRLLRQVLTFPIHRPQVL